MSFPIFGDTLNMRKTLSSLTNHFVVQHIIHNQIMFREGEEPNNIYFIIDGEYKITKNIPLQKKENWNADPVMEIYLKKNNDSKKTQVKIFYF